MNKLDGGISEADLIDFLGGKCRTPEIAAVIRAQWKVKDSPIAQWYDDFEKQAGAPLERVNWASVIESELAEAEESSPGRSDAWPKEMDPAVFPVQRQQRKSSRTDKAGWERAAPIVIGAVALLAVGISWWNWRQLQSMGEQVAILSETDGERRVALLAKRYGEKDPRAIAARLQWINSAQQRKALGAKQAAEMTLSLIEELPAGNRIEQRPYQISAQVTLAAESLHAKLFDEAERRSQLAFELAQSTDPPDVFGLIFATGFRIAAAQGLKDDQKTLAIAQEARTFLEQHQLNSPRWALAWANYKVAEAHATLGQTAAAIPLAERAEVLFERSDRTDLAIENLQLLTELYSKIRDEEGMSRAINNAYELTRATSDGSNLAQLGEMALSAGEANLFLGRPHRALSILDELPSYATPAGKRSKVLGQLLKAKALVDLALNPEAEEVAQIVLDQTAGDGELVSIFLGAAYVSARALFDQGQLDAALARAKATLAVAHENRQSPPALVAALADIAGRISAELNDPVAADKYYKDALTLIEGLDSQDGNRAITLGNRAKLLAESGDSKGAEKLFAEALALSRKVGSPRSAVLEQNLSLAKAGQRSGYQTMHYVSTAVQPPPAAPPSGKTSRDSL